MNCLAIVIPCYNEEEALDETVKQLSSLLKDLIGKGKIDSHSYLLLVNDGSLDHTWNIIQELHTQNSYVSGLNLSANVGHQNALYAGLMKVKNLCDIAISIDADLQDDIIVIEEMVDAYINGADIVYGVRRERKTDTFFKRMTAQSFYKLMSLMGVKTVYNHADYRLMSQRALEALSQYKERNLFLRGIVPLIGYKSESVYYARKERLYGESKYPLKKMISFAWEGITSFSIKPLSLIMFLGFFVTIISVIIIVYSLIRWLMGDTVTGWTSLFISLWFIGGVQLISVGMLGQYIGKIYSEVKERPRYNIEEFIHHD